MSTLHSIEEIEYNNFEIIIVDDSSTDQTAEVLLEYQKTHHNFKYIRLPQNSGSTIARTIGLNASDNCNSKCNLLRLKDAN
jgi:glycosyltransferase involved in cell wall biosynthesis